jgi:hypothetical protein
MLAALSRKHIARWAGLGAARRSARKARKGSQLGALSFFARGYLLPQRLSSHSTGKASAIAW